MAIELSGTLIVLLHVLIRLFYPHTVMLHLFFIPATELLQSPPPLSLCSHQWLAWSVKNDRPGCKHMM